MSTRRLRTSSVGSALKTGELPEKETLLLWYLKVYLNIDKAFQSELCNCISLICDKSVRNSKFGIFELLVWYEMFANALVTGIVCMCVRASYMKLTRDTHLMQRFIYYYK